jgi:hypothetical protein
MARLAIVVGACIAGATAPALAQPVVEHSKVDVAPAGHAFTQLSIDNPLGDVRVEGYDGTAIRIESFKRAPDEDALDRLRVSLVPNSDGTVRITTTADRPPESRPVKRGAVSIDLIVHAPRDARIEAASSAGKLEVINMDAGGDLDTASGAISVENVHGELWTHSVSGATTLSTVFGSVDAATVAADVKLDGIDGDKLIASAHRGTINGRRVRAREIELTTTEGLIQLEAETGLHGHLVVASGHGNVDVKLHHHGGGVLVRARGSRVDLGAPGQPQPDGWVQKSFGKCDAPALVFLRTDLGTVQLTVVP